MKRNRMIRTMVDAWNTSDASLQSKPLVELIGNCSVLVENHCGVISYSPESIMIKTKNGCIVICGSGLCLTKMSFDQLRIRGVIKNVELRGTR